MTVGSPAATSKYHAGLSYQCMSGGNRGAITNTMPTKPCSGGIFTTHHFPASVPLSNQFTLHADHKYSCWDGKNLDSPDHASHMYNTVNSEGFTNAPACPSSHPVRVPQVTFETVWDTSKFNSMWPSGGANPFVWSFEGSATYVTSP
jgi:hypothetical protein